MMRRWPGGSIGWWILTACLTAGGVAADEFRIATEVYVGEANEPAVETITLFSGGLVYDFLQYDHEGVHREEFTIFDLQRNRIVLLDPQRRVQTTLTPEFVMDFVAQMKARLGESGRAEFADPKFELHYDGETRQLVLKNDHIQYQVKGMRPKTQESFRQYVEFADWCARVNALRPGNSPPFARLRINAELADRNWLPTEVVRTIYYRRGLRRREYVVRTRHRASWVLSQSDRRRIDRAGTAMASYDSVPYVDYFRLRPASKP